MDDDALNSMCAVYAHLIETQLKSGDPDIEDCLQLLSFIQQNCITTAAEVGETPEQLEEYTFDSDDVSSEGGTVVVDGKEMPASAASVLDREGGADGG